MCHKLGLCSDRPRGRGSRFRRPSLASDFSEDLPAMETDSFWGDAWIWLPVPMPVFGNIGKENYTRSSNLLAKA